MDSKADVVERHRDRCMGLVDGYGDGRNHPLRQTDVGEPLGEGLDEVHRIGGDRLVQALRELAVVNGRGQVVGTRCRPGVQREVDVDDELLAVSALSGKYPVMPDGT
jgi:hypothetical protein